MSPFGFILTFFGAILVFGAIFYTQKKISLFFRFCIFFTGVSLILFTAFPSILRKLGLLFGLERGADLLVYVSVAILLYSVVFLLQKNAILSTKITRVIRAMTLQSVADFPIISTKTALVMACYNEESVIADTIEKIFSFDKNLAIVVIDDGSQDNSLVILQKLSAKFSNLRILHHSQNLGQWAALETGFEYIRQGNIESEYIVTFDADGQMDIEDLPKMLEIFKKNPEISAVLGSRFLEQKSYNMPFFRKILLKTGIIFTNLVSGIHLTDTHNGYRVFRKNILPKIRISLDGMSHASEILDIIAREKIPFRECGVKILYSDYSLHKGQKSSNSVKIAFNIIFKKFF